MEGPFRDLGSGFARLAGVEGLRRSPRRLRSVEDALVELLRNARDAGAGNVYVATTLRSRRYRTLTVVDDGEGIPETYRDLIFEPGVTTRHLRPVTTDQQEPPHGAGLSLHHIRAAALSADVISNASPTSIRVTFDTQTLPERSLQSGSRPSKTNLAATLAGFATTPNAPRLYHGSPAAILARLLNNRIIQSEEARMAAAGLGLGVSSRTVSRVVSGAIPPAEEVVAAEGGEKAAASTRKKGRDGGGGPILVVGEEEMREIGAVLRRVARASYLDVADLVAERKPGEVIFKARVYEPEDEYE